MMFYSLCLSKMSCDIALCNFQTAPVCAKRCITTRGHPFQMYTSRRARVCLDVCHKNANLYRRRMIRCGLDHCWCEPVDGSLQTAACVLTLFGHMTPEASGEGGLFKQFSPPNQQQS